MTLNSHLDRLTRAAADHDGPAGIAALHDIAKDCGPAVAAVVTADLIATGLRTARRRAATGDSAAARLLDQASALGLDR